MKAHKTRINVARHGLVAHAFSILRNTKSHTSRSEGSLCFQGIVQRRFDVTTSWASLL